MADIENLLTGFSYPEEYLRIETQNLLNLKPWIILDRKDAKDKFHGLQSRYPDKILMPFAIRIDSDDVACFEINIANKIVIIHDYSKSGWEQVSEFDNFWEWFKTAVEDMIEYSKED